jgi:EAL domain-containing protein (putative c-di-GMP-specific phosphodiesterase class I)
MSIPSFRDARAEASRLLHDQMGLGGILVDLLSLARVERQFGEQAYHALHSQIEPVLLELRDRLLPGAILTRDDRRPDRFLFFLDRTRPRASAFAAQELRSVADRVEAQLTARVARLAQPYLRERAAIDVGYGFIVFSPLESEERQFLRLLDDCLDTAALRRRMHEREDREQLLEIIHNRTVWNAFQPIVEMSTRSAMGHEGLSRGPRGSELEPPLALFRAAARHGLVEEVERACRRQIFVDWEVFGAPGHLFMNTVPATVRDPSFMGRGVLDYLGPRLSPRLITLEINERQVIENLGLYREAMHAFLDIGFSFAIDDVGAGYSGLETIANLGASYLKIDMGLVRDVNQKRISQEIIKAILEMGASVGATVIAEGIETTEEAERLLELGVRYGQGYLYARPADPYDQKRAAVAAPGR